MRGAFGGGLAGVEDAAGLNEHELNFVFRGGLVHDAFRDDEHFSGAEGDVAVAKIQAERAVEDEESFVGVGVVVPDEVALQFDDLELVVVHLGDDFGGPLVVEEGELIFQVDGLRHGVRIAMAGVVRGSGREMVIAAAGEGGDDFSMAASQVPGETKTVENIFRLGRIVFAAAMVAIGVQHLVYAQGGVGSVPVIPWIPAVPVLAYFAGAFLIAAGLCVAAGFRLRVATTALAAFFLAALAAVLIGRQLAVWAVAFEIVAMAAAALQLARSAGGRSIIFESGRYLFAISCVAFGAFHFMNLRLIAGLVPSWLPGGMFWAVFFGGAMIATGICLAVRWVDRVALLLLGVMFFLFFVLLHVPRVMHARHDADEWSSAWIALAMWGACWIFAGRAAETRD